MVELVVSTRGSSLLTVTACTDVPTCIVKSTSCVAPTVSSAPRVSVWKPVAAASILYWPGSSAGTRKIPSALVITVVATPVALLVTVIVEFGTSPPLASFTVPTKLPSVPSWAWSAAAEVTMHRSANRHVRARTRKDAGVYLMLPPERPQILHPGHLGRSHGSVM